MREIIKPAIILFLVCSVFALALSFTSSVTKSKIAEYGVIAANDAKKEVLPSAQNFRLIPSGIIKMMAMDNGDLKLVKEAYEGFSDNKSVGHVFMLSSVGYGGEIKISVGIDTKGKITGVKVGENLETPGLGSKAAEKPFISQFVNVIPKGAFKVVKNRKKSAVKNEITGGASATVNYDNKDSGKNSEEIDAIAGATITSKAVTKAVQAAVDTALKLNERKGR